MTCIRLNYRKSIRIMNEIYGEYFDNENFINLLKRGAQIRPVVYINGILYGYIENGGLYITSVPQ